MPVLAKVAAITLAPWVVRQKMFLFWHHAAQGVKVSTANISVTDSLTVSEHQLFEKCLPN